MANFSQVNLQMAFNIPNIIVLISSPGRSSLWNRDCSFYQPGIFCPQPQTSAGECSGYMQAMTVRSNFSCAKCPLHKMYIYGCCCYAQGPNKFYLRFAKILCFTDLKYSTVEIKILPGKITIHSCREMQ